MASVVFDPARALVRLATKLRDFPSVASMALEEFRRMEMLRLLQAVKQHASGRPGPNVVTGHYVGAFYIKETGTMSSVVTNDSPQTARLEYGFTGVDSLGRNYHQPPFPHFRPALAEIRPEYIKGIPIVVARAWSSS